MNVLRNISWILKIIYASNVVPHAKNVKVMPHNAYLVVKISSKLEPNAPAKMVFLIDEKT